MSRDISHTSNYNKCHFTTTWDLSYKADTCQISFETYLTPQTIRNVTLQPNGTYFIKQSHDIFHIRLSSETYFTDQTIKYVTP